MIVISAEHNENRFYLNTNLLRVVVEVFVCLHRVLVRPQLVFFSIIDGCTFLTSIHS
jgi:hypothetical protein